MEANATRLRVVLSRNRLQQKEVADAIGVSRMAVWSWVNGHAEPGGSNLVRLLEYLKRFEPSLQVEDLLGAACGLVGREGCGACE